MRIKSTGMAMLATVILGVSAATASAAGDGFSASGEGWLVVGPQPHDMERTRRVAGSIVIQDDGRAKAEGFASARLVAEFTDRGQRYRVISTDLEVRWVPVMEAGRIPTVGPRLLAWGHAQVHRDGALLASKTIIVVTVLADPPIKGISLEVSTTDRALPRVPHGYLHVVWTRPLPLTARSVGLQARAGASR